MNLLFLESLVNDRYQAFILHSVSILVYDRPPMKDPMDASATKRDLLKFATREDLQQFATKKDLEAFATKRDLQDFATKRDVANAVSEMRLLNENLADDFRQSTADQVEVLKDIAKDHGSRIVRLEDKVGVVAA